MMMSSAVCICIYIRARGSSTFMIMKSPLFFILFLFWTFSFLFVLYQALFFLFVTHFSFSFHQQEYYILPAGAVFIVRWGGGWTEREESKRETRTGSHLIKHSWKSTPLRRWRRTSDRETSLAAGANNNESFTQSRLCSTLFAPDSTRGVQFRYHKYGK